MFRASEQRPNPLFFRIGSRNKKGISFLKNVKSGVSQQEMFLNDIHDESAKVLSKKRKLREENVTDESCSSLDDFVINDDNEFESLENIQRISKVQVDDIPGSFRDG